MKTYFLKIVKYGALIGILVLMSLTLIPRNYNVLKFEKREGTKYWNLETGSKIGYYLIKGKSTQVKDPIIYLHGGPGSMIHDDIIDFFRPLSKEGHDIYLYDQIGSGHSERLKHISEYTAERHKKDLEAIINKIGSETVILLGQSWGAMLSMLYVTDHSERVNKMIFTGPGPILPIKHELSKIQAPDSLNLKTPIFSNREGNKRAYNFRSRFILFCGNKLGWKIGSDKEADDFFTYLNTELKKSTKCDPSEAEESLGGGGYYAHIRTVRSFREVQNNRSKLEGMEVPLLIIKGQCDNQKWGFTEEYLKLLPNTDLRIIKDAGHSVSSEDQELYIEIIRNFLRS